MRNKLLGLLLFLFPALAGAVSVDLNVSGGVSAIQDQVIDDLTVNGNTVIGSGTEDSATLNADDIIFPNDTIITLGGGANGLTITGDVIIASNSVIDAFNSSFGAVTAGSTSTLTWTEVTDRRSEFVTSSFTVTLAGLYEVTARAEVVQTAGTGCLLLKNNNATVTGGSFCEVGVTGLSSTIEVSFSRILSLAVNDVVRVDGSATTANGTFQRMALTIKRIP